MKKENKLEIESVSYEYVGTDKEFNAFLNNVIREYIDDDKTSVELVFETHIEEINIAQMTIKIYKTNIERRKNK